MSRVLYLKPGAAKNFCIVDAAMNDLDAPGDVPGVDGHRAVPLRDGAALHLRRRRPGLRVRRLARAATARSPCSAGDLLAVLSAGAYCMSDGEQLQQPAARRRGDGRRRRRRGSSASARQASELFRGERLLPSG